MSFLVVALLSVLWLGFFLPSLLQARRTSSPYASATTFQDSLRRLSEVPYPQPAQPQERRASPHARPSRAAAVAARRRDILAVLAAAVVAGAAVAVSFGGWALWAPVPPALALVGYVVMLRREVTRRARRARPVTVVDDASGVEALEQVLQPVPPAPDDADIVPSVARRSAAPPPERMAG